MSATPAATQQPSELPVADEDGAAPTFMLARPTYHAQAFGITARFDSVDAARTALATGAQIVGALPFDSRQPASLIAPVDFKHTAGQWRRPVSPLPSVEIIGTEPAPSEHVRRVADAIRAVRDPESELAKVVLARTVELRAKSPIHPLALLAQLVDSDHDHNGFLADLTSAGREYHGHHLIGSSPEVLVRREGSTVTCHPLAGSAARLVDPLADRASGQQLATSTKDLDEHSFVVDALAAALQPLCRDLQVPPVPTLTKTPTLWHLGTPIRATLRDSATTALDLAATLHPTPAICGTPTIAARDYIVEHEEQRGFYAGAVGWCDSSGDGEWMVSIRCAELAADHRTIRTAAGGGIVADSDPDQELAETTTKFRTVLSALGLAPTVTDTGS